MIPEGRLMPAKIYGEGVRALEKVFSLTLDDGERLACICKALSSETRIRMLRLLCAYKLNVNELAEKLEIPASSAAINVKALEEAGLIGTEVQSGVRGSAKLCYKAVSSLEVSFVTEEADDNSETVSMPVGNYVDYKVEPTCGLVSEKGRIDGEDEPGAFYNPERTSAKLLWLGKGYVEYRFPNHMLADKKIKRIEFSAELCSEDHEYNLDWPSDITMWINGREAGTWNCPSDYGGRRGRLNPDWWPDKNTQYGMLKTWRITDRGTYLDKVKVSGLTLADYDLTGNGFISVRLGNAEDAKHQGGMNIFGDCFGDYPQGINMKIVYK